MSNLENEVMTCVNCGRVVESGEEAFIAPHGGGYICCDCNNELPRCDCCGDIILADEEVSASNGDTICEACFNNYYTTCDDCGDIIHIDDSLCTGYDGVICHDCYCNNYFTCCDCGEIVHIDYIFYDRHDNPYCESCYNDIDSIIEGYHNTSTDLEFFGITGDNKVPYLGVELEVEVNGANAETQAGNVKNALPDNFVYFEEDGSLNEGFEIITQPATLDYHKGLKSTYEQAFKDLSRAGVRSHNTTTCGLHVHFSRSIYKDNEDLYVARLLYITEKFWDNMVKFSRRRISNIDRWAKKYDTPIEDIVKQKNEGRLGRYFAVNLTNRTTIEFRMFRGTLNVDTFMATLELSHRLATLPLEITSSEALQALTWEDIINTDTMQAYWEQVKDRGQ